MASKKKLRCNSCGCVWTPKEYPSKSMLYNLGSTAHNSIMVFNLECPSCGECDCSPYKLEKEE